MTGTQPDLPDDGTDIVIRCGGRVLAARLNVSPTALAVVSALPLDSEAGRFGDEVYFEVPVVSKLSEDARDVLMAGDIAYWPPGKAVCVFWGPTPASVGSEIRAASKVNVIGQVTGDPTILSGVRDGEIIRVEKA